MSDSTIDRATALEVAKLARIQLDEEHADQVQSQLAKILDYVGQLNQVSMPADVEPFFGATDSVNAVRSDEASASFARESVLDNAPDTDGEFYLVPPVFSK